MSSDKIGYAVYYNVLVVCRFGDSPDPECRSTTSTIAGSKFSSFSYFPFTYSMSCTEGQLHLQLKDRYQSS